MIIAIIPARYSSKRIKRKNIKLFHSKPIIYWTIKKLIKSNIFDKIVVSSDSQLILDLSKKFGAQCVVVAIDVKKNSSGNYEVFTRGGSKATGLDAVNWAIEAQKLGAGEILLTSMDRDGTKSGYDLDLLQKISSVTNIPLIASGGVGTLEHLAQGLKSGASAVLAASIFHFKTRSIQEAKQYLKSQNLAVRI